MEALGSLHARAECTGKIGKGRQVCLTSFRRPSFLLIRLCSSTMALPGLARPSSLWPEALLVSLVGHALLFRSGWAHTWLVSGAAPLSYLLLSGELNRRRILPWAPHWLLLLLINLAEAASSTSWLFFTLFTLACWPFVFLASLYQFDLVANTTRNVLRRVLRFMHFAADTVALFDLPALEIDVDVAGLMAVRGITLSLSSLTLTAYGIEVGIKLSDDLELALQADKVTVYLFRRIKIGDVYGNVKGGKYEQSFANVKDDTRTADNRALMDSDSPMLQRAATMADEEASRERESTESDESDTGHTPPPLPARPSVRATRDDDDGGQTELAGALPIDFSDRQSDAQSEVETASVSGTAEAGPGAVPSRSSTYLSDASTASIGEHQSTVDEVGKTSMADKMTGGKPPADASAEEGVRQTRSFVADDSEAGERLRSAIAKIEETSEVRKAEATVRRRVNRKGKPDPDMDLDVDNDRHLRAAICTRLHRKPSIQHPPRWSVRVSTLQKLAPPWLVRLMHRMPLLLRLMLNPLAYFHPITMDSATMGASGHWMKFMLSSELFESYAENSADIGKLRDRVFHWLDDANFVIGLSEFTGQGLVPIDPHNDITCRMAVDEVTLYRTVPSQATLKKSIQLGGADATVLVPSMMMPHHDHLLPSQEDRKRQQEDHREHIRMRESMPKVAQARRDLEQNVRDEANVPISVHIRLPACFDQDLLNFITTLVKASKIIEFQRAFKEVAESEIRSFKDLTRLVNSGIREGMKKATVNAAANDQWIAKMVGKIVKKLESTQGDVGYSGAIRVPLDPYRAAAVPGESKLLP